MAADHPSVVILAGPNGAGKSTCAPNLLQGHLSVEEFVNADVVARGLSGFHPESVAAAAGRLVLRRLHELADQRTSFAFETTLATRSFAPWLRELRTGGYQCHIVFLWLTSENLAVSRVRSRVAMGGHGIPEATIRRRYRRGVHNLFELYQPLADTWLVLDNSHSGDPSEVARGALQRVARVHRHDIWNRIRAEFESR